MYWAKRDFEYADYAKYLDLLAKLQLADARHYAEFIMVSTNTRDPGLSTYYVGVPNETFLSFFDGFQRVQENELPKAIDTVHLADATKEPFKQRFNMREPLGYRSLGM